MSEKSFGEFNAVAIVGAVVAVLGLACFAYGMSMAMGPTVTINDVEQVDVIRLKDGVGVAYFGGILLSIAVLLIAVAVPIGNASTVNKLKTRLQSDFYRRCPSCGEWNTWMVSNCTACRTLLPKLHDMESRVVGPRAFRDEPFV